MFMPQELGLICETRPHCIDEKGMSPDYEHLPLYLSRSTQPLLVEKRNKTGPRPRYLKSHDPSWIRTCHDHGTPSDHIHISRRS